MSNIPLRVVRSRGVEPGGGFQASLGDGDGGSWGCALPLVVFPAKARGEASAVDELGSALRRAIQRHLPRVGMMLLRGFSGPEQMGLPAWVSRVVQDTVAVLGYEGWPGDSGCAGHVDGRAVSSQALHSAYGYGGRFPARLWLRRPVAQGACVLCVADRRQVYQALSRPLRERLEQRQVVLVHEFPAAPMPETGGAAQTWPAVFGTRRRGAVEAWCRPRGLAWEWLQNGGLRVRQGVPLWNAHPVTGEKVWFHSVRRCSGLKAGAALHYADGRPVETAILDALADALQAQRQELCLEGGDVLLLDNLSVAHEWSVGLERVPAGSASSR